MQKNVASAPVGDASDVGSKSDRTLSRDESGVDTVSTVSSKILAVDAQRKFLRSRLARLSELAQRRSAARWSPKKKAKFARRQLDASRLITQADDNIALLMNRLAQLEDSSAFPLKND